MQGNRDRTKRYVMVVSRTDEMGRTLPLKIIWHDGTSYDIDQVLGVERMSSRKVGGTGMRYRVRIGRVETDLYFEDPRWFVEEKGREQ